MGKRQLTKREKDEIVDGIYKIQSSPAENKEEKYFKLYCKHEVNLEYIGASAIEDKLQDEVPETIEKLMDANIRVWVLTGDKQETAIEIAKSCRLIQEDMKDIKLSVSMNDRRKKINESDEQFEKRIADEKEVYKKELRENIQKGKIMIQNDVLYHTENEIFAQPLKNLKNRGTQITLVIDGPTLGLILEDEELGNLFLSLGLYSKSVVCCRVSPKQK